MTASVITRARVPEGLSHLRDLMSAYAARTSVRTVAALGNAPLAPSEERADAIDAADLVIRVNSFVLDEPETPRAQGKRADVVVWNRITRPTRHTFDRYRDRLYLLAEPMRAHGNPEMWPASWPADLGMVPLPNRDVLAPIGESLGVPWREERLAPTTGLTAAWLAVTLFPEAEVLLSGYSFVDNPTQTGWTYQGGGWSPVAREHRIEAEAQLVRSWLAEGRATLWR
ncbi:MAG: hypothetical protein QM638_21040 [Nocardioides sp.]|uniref:hypothetical protein n=1 Tax=Nocardioides sp. TaxID=35761 RepID=UPI0039E41BA5